jgi:hypothetical protein
LILGGALVSSISTDYRTQHSGREVPSPPGVFVVGMARSGTSAITRIVTLLGLSHCVENDLIGPKHYNRLGFFESRTLQSFNRILLLRWSREGWREPRLPAGWQREPAVRWLAPRAGKLFRSLHPAQPWVYKDSSLNFLLPFWIEALGCRPDAIFIYRHPVAVARSLERDAGISFDRCLRIWERHNRAAIVALEGLSVLLIDYDELVSDPRGVASAVADWLHSRGYAVPAGAQDAAASSIDEREQHWRAGAEEDARLPSELRSLLALLAQRRGAHRSWSCPLPASQPPERTSLRELLRLLSQRPRWWWWIAELIMPAPIARAARRLPAPRRRRARDPR